MVNTKVFILILATFVAIAAVGGLALAQITNAQNVNGTQPSQAPQGTGYGNYPASQQGYSPYGVGQNGYTYGSGSGCGRCGGGCRP